MILRPHQAELIEPLHNAWRVNNNVSIVLPTGAGKTVLFAHIIKNHNGASVVIAHRRELIIQISTALAREGVYHGIVGPKNVVNLVVKVHMEKIGRSFYKPNAVCKVAGIDTLIRRGDRLKMWANSVNLWVMDECHHILKANKWGQGVAMFPNARGLGVTATFERADGKGLGREYDGVFDDLIIGAGMRDIMRAGFLTDYRVIAPPSDLSRDISTGSNGDFTRNGLKLAAKKSHIVGDVVKEYLKFAPGKLGVTFTTDVETAGRIADEFNNNGVPSKVVHAKTKDADRVAILRDFENRKILNLVNVDLFGEGIDLPAIEVVSMARPTQSFVLYCQQFGRGLRIKEGKKTAIIIDHAGNVMHHGLPDKPREYSLARREKRSQEPVSSEKICPNPECNAVYSRIYKNCPYCEFIPEPIRRDGPEWVDGDLLELDAETLERMRGDADKYGQNETEYKKWMQSKYVPEYWQKRNLNIHMEKHNAQMTLRDNVALWAGFQRLIGHTDNEIYKKFYVNFNIDVLSAQGLAIRESSALNDKIKNDLKEWGCL